MSDSIVENNVVVEEKVTKTKKTKPLAKKAKVVVKRGQGRPKVYDHEVVVKVLNKYKGTQGGLKRAHGEISARKGYENIAFMTVAKISRDNGIKFKMGKPSEKKVIKKKAKAA